ncbi:MULTISPECIES: hypothetical protein [unclassified Methylobacterium]|uniref:hypothetical protein n=1 Tax=unclassified Methylobacterium TaxID=2615210 RepID=UPI0011C20E54|nr:MULTISPECIES: hypothetical protein [unclassified Methylobacterium]QEE38189.1 hypothetical protein FVA80_03550 [Methylobacterium sp. WL1]TXN55149.1 hypothetical protein FV241_21055 [Methylobacterium sp. WL2]
MPDDYHFLKNLLTFTSPAAAVVVSVISVIVISAVKRRILKSEINKSLAEARRLRDDANNSASSTAAHKKQVQLNVEKLEMALLVVLTEGVEEVRAGLSANLRA